MRKHAVTCTSTARPAIVTVEAASTHKEAKV